MRKRRVFLAAPISSLLTNNRDYHTASREAIEAIISALREDGYDVFCAVEREGWGKVARTGVHSTLPDYVGLFNSDIVVAIPHRSYGVHMELGWAAALKKPVVFCQNERVGSLSPLVSGMETVTTVKMLSFNSIDPLPRDEALLELIQKVRKAAAELSSKILSA